MVHSAAAAVAEVVEAALVPEVEEAAAAQEYTVEAVMD
jgi:hypothetical protein